jgi:hypothetical protein
VATDLVLAVPVAIALCYIGIVDPGLLTGG